MVAILSKCYPLLVVIFLLLLVQQQDVQTTALFWMEIIQQTVSSMQH